MIASDPTVPAILDRHHGELVQRTRGHPLWLGDLTPALLADLMREGSAGPLQVHPEGQPSHDVWIERCWYDVAAGRMAVELRRRDDLS